MPVPSIMVAGFASKEVFCELKLFHGIATEECFSSELFEEFFVKL